MEFKIVSYSKGPHEFDSDFWKTLHAKNKIAIDVNSILRYNSQSEFVGLQFDISCNFENKIFFKSGFLFGIMIPELLNVFKDSPTLENHRDIVAMLVQFIWPAVVGVVADQTAQHHVLPLILPKIDVEKFAQEVTLSLSK